MIKLQFSKPHFHTYNEGKTTICIYSCKVIDNDNKEIKAEFKTTGKAICSENDTLDPAVGRMIADSRAKYKAYKIAYSMHSGTLIGYYKKQLRDIYNVVEFNAQMQYLKKMEEQHITDLCDVQV